MTLNSFMFLSCFCILLITLTIIQWLSFFLKSQVRNIQKLVLLIASYGFIAYTDWRFLFCILFVSGITYIFGICIEKYKKTVLLAIGVIVLVGFLVYFKYAGFFIDSFAKLIGRESVTARVFLPIGVSFYTFSAISYLIDIFRSKYNAERNIVNFGLFVSFFPKLSSGPIVRGNDFLPQIQKYKGIEWGQVKTGIQIMMFGMFKKFVLANHLSVFVDDIFRAPKAFDNATIVLAAVSYSLQIYFDFSGYSDIAIGASKMLGFDFKSNFNLPYFARNLSEFWKRWHISLSSWFQDYLYIPLGGSRKGEIRTFINMMIVMLISGLWHGAGWTFIVWGVLHGLASSANKLFEKYLIKLGLAVNTFLTFIVVTLLWVVFRAESLSAACSFCVSMFTPHQGIHQPFVWSYISIVCSILEIMIAYIHSKRAGTTGNKGIIKVNSFYPVLDFSHFWQMVCFFVFCGVILVFGYFGNTVFIYDAF